MTYSRGILQEKIGNVVVRATDETFSKVITRRKGRLVIKTRAVFTRLVDECLILDSPNNVEPNEREISILADIRMIVVCANSRVVGIFGSVLHAERRRNVG